MFNYDRSVTLPKKVDFGQPPDSSTKYAGSNCFVNRGRHGLNYSQAQSSKEDVSLKKTPCKFGRQACQHQLDSQVSAFHLSKPIPNVKHTVPKRQRSIAELCQFFSSQVSNSTSFSPKTNGKQPLPKIATSKNSSLTFQVKSALPGLRSYKSSTVNSKNRDAKNEADTKGEEPTNDIRQTATNTHVSRLRAMFEKGTTTSPTTEEATVLKTSIMRKKSVSDENIGSVLCRAKHNTQTFTNSSRNVNKAAAQCKAGPSSVTPSNVITGQSDVKKYNEPRYKREHNVSSSITNQASTEENKFAPIISRSSNNHILGVSQARALFEGITRSSCNPAPTEYRQYSPEATKTDFIQRRSSASSRDQSNMKNSTSIHHHRTVACN